MLIQRKKNAIRGTFWGLFRRGIQIFCPFLLRSVFLRTIGVEYLGLNSLFAAILQMLNLTEMGFSSVVVFSMYRPIADNDGKAICRLMRFYRFYYRIIGFAILCIGCILIPFLPLLIKETLPENVNLYTLYLLNLGATVLTYWLFAYRNCLFEAHQRLDVINIVGLLVDICMYALQIVTLINLKSYYCYLIVKIVGQIGVNLLSAALSKHYYPDYRPEGQATEEERTTIKKKVKELFVSKLGGAVNSSAEIVIISSVLGLEILVIYQNYLYIISSVMALFHLFYEACKAGVGNSLITRRDDENRQLLYRLNHIVFMTLNICCGCLISVYQPFMKAWVGEKLMLPGSLMVLFIVYFFAEESLGVLTLFKDAGGLWKADQARSLTVAGVDLILAVILIPRFKLYGALIAAIIALSGVSLPWIGNIVDKGIFRIGIRRYYGKTLLYTGLIAINMIALSVLGAHLCFQSRFAEIIIRFIIGGVVSAILFEVFFGWMEENRYFRGLVKESIFRCLKRA